jgi:predicted permease
MEITSWLNTVSRDALHAIRLFARNPIFTIVALLSLATGIGANTAVFSIIDAALLRSLPVKAPHELVILTDPDASGVSSGLDTGTRRLLSYSEFAQLREHAASFSGLCATEAELNRWHIRIAGGATEEARGRLVSEDYFLVLGVRPAAGRFFSPGDAKGAGQDPYVVISDEYWKRRFGGNASIVGGSIHVGNANLTVIGVAEAGFHGETVGESPDFWMPLMMQPLVIPGRDWLNENPSQMTKIMWLHVLGRLKPGTGASQAQTEINVLFRRILENSFPASLDSELRKQALDQRLVLHDARTGVFANRDDFTQQLLLLLAAAIVVLAIACINVANLLLARGADRHREVAVRISLGATRGRVVRQFLTESLVLALMGGISGLLVAWGALHLLTRLLSAVRSGLELSPGMDWRVLSFNLCFALGTGIVFGLAPALRGAELDLYQGLRDSGRVTASSGKLKLTKGLAVCQIGLSLAAVILAGLFLRTLWNLQAVGLGYPREKLLLITVDGVHAGYKGPALTNLWRDLEARMQSLPGVRSVSYSINGLFGGNEADDEIQVEGYKPRREEEKISQFDVIGPGYFSTLGIPLLRGREFGLQDGPHAPSVAVVNEAFADRFFAGRNPLGMHITEGTGNQVKVMQVIGVARNARDHSLRGEVPPRFYVPGDQGIDGPNEWAIFEIRTEGEPEQMLATVRKAIVGVNENLYPTRGQPLTLLLENNMAHPRMIARLCTLFGILGLLLAAGGLYGVLSYSIARRTNEIGIRMALGAAPGKVASMVLRETGVMLLTGAALGTALTTISTRFISSRLYGLSTLDPLTIAAAICLFGVVAVLAAFIPAMRAARVSPITALRHE